MNTGIGPQPKTGDAWVKRMRLHQSWYRHYKLGVGYGTGPTKDAKTRYGYMLATEAAACGRNFLTQTILETVRDRLSRSGMGGGIDKFRLMHNMLSSQPMCFNLFGELSRDRKLATVLCQALWGRHISRVLDVRFEWAPTPQRDYLGDSTAFDVFIEYKTKNGELGFISIETKLTEDFSTDEYDRIKYRQITEESPWWPDDINVTKLSSSKFNQLWRNHLLSYALLTHQSSTYAQGTQVVIHHPLDTKCAKTVVDYKKMLSENSCFVAFDLQEIMSIWSCVLEDCEASQWLNDFDERYLQMDLSEADAGRPKNSSYIRRDFSKKAHSS